MNERELRLLRSLVDSLRSIQREIRAIYDQSNAKSHQEQPPAPIDIRSEIQLPPAVAEYYATEHRDHPENTWRDRIRLGLEALALAAAIWAAAFTFRTLDQVRRQADAAQNQVGIMQKQFEAADRPWISVDTGLASPLTYDTKGVHVNFNFVAENVGKSPAQNVMVSAELDSGIMGTDERSAQKKLCDAAAKSTVNPRYVVFPGRKFVQEIAFTKSIEELNSFWSKFELSQGPIDLIPLILVGCADYNWDTSSRHHQTGFVLDVLMKDRRLVLKSMTPVAPNSILLMQHPFGGFFAN